MRRLFWLLLLALPASAQTAPSVLLSWGASATTGTHVNVYRAHGSCSNPFVRIATGQNASGPYTDAYVIPGATYAYQVTAYLNGVESAPSNCIVLTIAQPVVSPPFAPTGLTAIQQ